jgi:hypothetical protein
VVARGQTPRADAGNGVSPQGSAISGRTVLENAAGPFTGARGTTIRTDPSVPAEADRFATWERLVRRCWWLRMV